MTGALTAGVAFVVFVDGLKTEPLEMARTHAFAALVFAELLRSFGARSEIKPVWQIPLRTNIKLALVVVVSFGFQIITQYNHVLARVFNTSVISIRDSLLLVALSLIPLIVLEVRKQVYLLMARQRRPAPR